MEATAAGRRGLQSIRRKNGPLEHQTKRNDPLLYIQGLLEKGLDEKGLKKVAPCDPAPATYADELSNSNWSMGLIQSMTGSLTPRPPQSGQDPVPVHCSKECNFSDLHYDGSYKRHAAPPGQPKSAQLRAAVMSGCA